MVTAEQTQYLTVDEAAVRAGVSSITVRRAVKAGQLKYRKRSGATKLLAASDVDRWAEKRSEIGE